MSGSICSLHLITSKRGSVLVHHDGALRVLDGGP